MNLVDLLLISSTAGVVMLVGYVASREHVGLSHLRSWKGVELLRGGWWVDDRGNAHAVGGDHVGFIYRNKLFVQEAEAAHTDPYSYALTHAGWTRLRDNVIETSKLSSDKLHVIADGIEAAAGGVISPDAHFMLEDLKGHFYAVVPWHVIRQGNMRLLKEAEAA